MFDVLFTDRVSIDNESIFINPTFKDARKMLFHRYEGDPARKNISKDLLIEK